MPGSTVTTLPATSARLRRARQPRRLVDLQPDAVAEAVAEVLGVPGGGDQVARDRVDLAPLGARPDGVQRRLLRASTVS